MKNKKGKTDFTFIAKHPAAILVAGGVLAALIGKELLGFILIGIGVVIHIYWIDHK